MLDALPAGGGEVGDGARPVVSIMIPTRNEEDNLVGCLAALASVVRPRLEIIVVDDHSQDATLERAQEWAQRDGRIRVLPLRELPPGWTGKNHALFQGSRVAVGEWLLFIDADVRLALRAVETALAFALNHRVDLVSLSPLQRAGGFWEHLVQPLIYDLLDERFDLRAVNDPTTPDAAANGQFVLVRRAVYASIGGHEAIKGEILEDVVLAQKLKAAGGRLYFAKTRSLAETRMYRGLRELREGWRKNLFLLLGGDPARVVLMAFRTLLVWVAPILTTAGAWLLGGRLGFVALISGVTVLALGLGAAVCLFRAQHAPVRYAPLIAVGQLVVASLVLASWWAHAVRRGVLWKGREYPQGNPGYTSMHRN